MIRALTIGAGLGALVWVVGQAGAPLWALVLGGLACGAASRSS